MALFWSFLVDRWQLHVTQIGDLKNGQNSNWRPENGVFKVVDGSAMRPVAILVISLLGGSGTIHFGGLYIIASRVVLHG